MGTIDLPALQIFQFDHQGLIIFGRLFDQFSHIARFACLRKLSTSNKEFHSTHHANGLFELFRQSERGNRVSIKARVSRTLTQACRFCTSMAYCPMVIGRHLEKNATRFVSSMDGQVSFRLTRIVSGGRSTTQHGIIP